MKKKLLMGLLCGLGVAGLVCVTSCNNGGDDDEAAPTGTATLQGNVSSFAAEGWTMFFLPREKPGMGRRFMAAVADFVVPSAEAAGLSGVYVYLKDTDFHTTTADDGVFVFSGIPAGTYQIGFKYRRHERLYGVQVGDNERLELIDISVSNGGVAVARENRVSLIAPPPTSGGGGKPVTPPPPKPNTGGEMPF